MSHGGLPSYAEVPPMPRSQPRTPAYAPTAPPHHHTLPHHLHLHSSPRARSRSRPPGEFVKRGKNLVLRLAAAQVPGSELPVYGLARVVDGKVELAKPEGISSIEVKVEGTLQLHEIAESGMTTRRLCHESVMLWSKRSDGASTPICPSSLSFVLMMPSTYSDGEKSYPLPPSYSEHLPGVPGFQANINYVINVVVNNQKSGPSLVKSAFLGTSTPSLSAPFIYYPRTRPAAPLPPPLRKASTNLGLTQSPHWRMYEQRVASRVPGGQDITSRLYIPASRIFSRSQPIPFHLTFSGSAFALAAFLPFLPTASLLSPYKQHTKIELLRQSIVDVRNKVIMGAKTDIWRVDCIGQGTFKHAGDGPDWISFVGEIYVNDNVTLGGFKASGLTVKDCIVLSMTPPDPVKSPFRELRQVVPVLLTTDAYGSQVQDQASEHSVPSTPSTSEHLEQMAELGYGT